MDSAIRKGGIHTLNVVEDVAAVAALVDGILENLPVPAHVEVGVEGVGTAATSENYKCVSAPIFGLINVMNNHPRRYYRDHRIWRC